MRSSRFYVFLPRVHQCLTIGWFTRTDWFENEADRRPVPAVGSHDNRRNNRKGASIARRRLNTSGITFADLEPRSCTRATVSRSLINIPFRDGASHESKTAWRTAWRFFAPVFLRPFPPIDNDKQLVVGSLINHPDQLSWPINALEI